MLCKSLCEMATNLDIDQALLKKAQEIGRHKTKKAAVNEALKEYVQRRKQLEIVHLFGTLDWDENYNYKADRKKDNEDIPE